MAEDLETSMQKARKRPGWMVPLQSKSDLLVDKALYLFFGAEPFSIEQSGWKLYRMASVKNWYTKLVKGEFTYHSRHGHDFANAMTQILWFEKEPGKAAVTPKQISKSIEKHFALHAPILLTYPQICERLTNKLALDYYPEPLQRISTQDRQFFVQGEITREGDQQMALQLQKAGAVVQAHKMNLPQYESWAKICPGPKLCLQTKHAKISYVPHYKFFISPDKIEDQNTLSSANKTAKMQGKVTFSISKQNVQKMTDIFLQQLLEEVQFFEADINLYCPAKTFLKTQKAFANKKHVVVLPLIEYAIGSKQHVSVAQFTLNRLNDPLVKFDPFPLNKLVERIGLQYPYLGNSQPALTKRMLTLCQDNLNDGEPKKFFSDEELGWFRVSRQSTYPSSFLVHSDGWAIDPEQFSQIWKGITASSKITYSHSTMHFAKATSCLCAFLKVCKDKADTPVNIPLYASQDANKKVKNMFFQEVQANMKDIPTLTGNMFQEIESFWKEHKHLLNVEAKNIEAKDSLYLQPTAPFSERGNLTVAPLKQDLEHIQGSIQDVLALLSVEKDGIEFHKEEKSFVNSFGRLSPMHDDYKDTNNKLLLPEGYAVLHGMTGIRSYGQALWRFRQMIISGGMLSISERRRHGFSSTTMSPLGDMASGIDWGVPFTIGPKPSYGKWIFFMLKHESLHRKDIFFADRDYGGGRDRWPLYQKHAQKIGQGEIYLPPSHENRQKHVEAYLGKTNEVWFRWMVPWNDIDTIFVSRQNGLYAHVIEVVKKAKQYGWLPSDLRIEGFSEENALENSAEEAPCPANLQNSLQKRAKQIYFSYPLAKKPNQEIQASKSKKSSLIKVQWGDIVSQKDDSSIDWKKLKNYKKLNLQGNLSEQEKEQEMEKLKILDEMTKLDEPMDF